MKENEKMKINFGENLLFASIYHNSFFYINLIRWLKRAVDVYYKKYPNSEHPIIWVKLVACAYLVKFVFMSDLHTGDVHFNKQPIKLPSYKSPLLFQSPVVVHW